jgi:Gpi18-like mannosyltransferase
MPDETTESSELGSYLLIISVVIFSSFLALMPFLFGLNDVLSIHFWETGMQLVYRFWDGPLYVVVSQTFYAPESPLYAASGFWPSYYSAHFPLYPFVIRLLSFIGVFEGMIVATVLFTCAAALVFYKIVKEFGIADHPLLLTIFFCFFPMRWFLYRNVGASEAAFVFLCLVTIYFLKKDKIEFSVISATLATLTRIFGVFLLPVILASLPLKKQLTLKNVLLTLLIPTALLVLFSWYFVSFGDFYAYFGVNAVNIREPFHIMISFNDAYFRELYGILIVIYAVAAFALWDRGEKEMSLFVIIYLAFVTLVAHGDASRYMIPMAPFALIGFEKVFPKNRVAFIAIIVITAILSLIYAWTVIPINPMPEETYLRIRETIAMM